MTTLNLQTALRGYIVLPLLTVLLLAMSGARAQERGKPEPEPTFEPSLFIGAFGGLALVTHSAAVGSDYFSGRVTFPPQAEFELGEGNGILGGFLLEVPLSRNFRVGARLGYQTRDGVLTKSYINNLDVSTPGGGPQEGLVTGNVDTELGYLYLTPHILILPLSLPVYFFAGPTIAYPMSAGYTHSETIRSPAVARFRDNGRKNRNLSGGDLPTPTLAFGTSVGLEVDVALSERTSLIFDLQYSPMFTDVASDLRDGEKWTTSTLSGTVGLRFGLGEQPPMPEPPDTLVAELDTVPKVPTFEAKAVMPEGLSDTLLIRANEVRATEVHAILPYIFFEQDSAILPARYATFDRRGGKYFEIERIERGSTMNVYYNLLNIIGQRMRRNRKAVLTLTGCTSQFEQDSTLALQRAEAVRSYLTDTWRLRENQINVVARGLPENPSLSEVDTLEGARENQRVEISCTDYDVLAPVRLPDTTFLAPAGVIRFFPPAVDTSVMVGYWSMDIAVGDSLKKNAESGFGPPPSKVDFTIENSPDLNFERPAVVSADLVLRDTLFEEIAAYKSNPVLILQEGEFMVKRNIVDGKYVDRYNLLLFSFDSADVFDFSRQATAVLKDRITPQSTVRILGHTDRIGLPPYNKKLSARRAEVAASLLAVEGAEVQGLGEKELLYDNDFPEGRYYSRTVTVIVETPIGEGDRVSADGSDVPGGGTGKTTE